MKKLIYGGLVGIIVLGTVTLIARSIRAQRPLEASASGHTLDRGFELKDFSTGKVVKLGELDGKLYLINFWASWCPGCITEMPSLVKLHEKMSAKGLRILAVNVDEDPASAIPPVLARIPMPFENYLDVSGALTKEFEVSVLPFTVILSKKLEVLWSDGGERDWNSDAVVSDISKMLEQN